MPEKVLELSISIKSFVSVTVLYILWLQQMGCSGNHVLMYQSQSKKSSLPSMYVHELTLDGILQLFEHASTLPMDFNSVQSWNVITACCGI